MAINPDRKFVFCHVSVSLNLKVFSSLTCCFFISPDVEISWTPKMNKIAMFVQLNCLTSNSPQPPESENEEKKVSDEKTTREKFNFEDFSRRTKNTKFLIWFKCFSLCFSFCRCHLSQCLILVFFAMNQQRHESDFLAINIHSRKKRDAKNAFVIFLELAISSAESLTLDHCPGKFMMTLVKNIYIAV